MFALVAIAAVTLLTATVALALRNLIHSALLLIASWAGIAAFYLWAGAEFLGFAQVLIYVGAISMVVLFAVLLTRRTRAETIEIESAWRAMAALLVGGGVFGLLVGAVVAMDNKGGVAEPRSIPVRTLGQELLGTHAASVLLAGALLTVALIGAVVLASSDARKPGPPQPHPME